MISIPLSRRLFLLLAAWLCLTAPCLANAQTAREILVRFTPAAGASRDLPGIASAIGRVTRTLPAIQTRRVTLKPGMTVEHAMEMLRIQSSVVSVERVLIRHKTSTPNDTYYSSNQYAPQLIGAEHAWELWKPTRKVVIAIIDTGVDYDHPDLTNKILRDGNGAVIGYDFVNSTAFPQDDDVDGHGTHCAGIAAAQVNNGQGIAGIAGWDGAPGHSDASFVKIMPVKVLGSDGKGSTTNISAGIIWAADHGANIISMSLGSADFSDTENQAVQYAQNKGCLVMAAAGNDGKPTPFYPAAYPHVLSVAATDKDDTLADFSNYGDWVKVAAPGSAIYSTLPRSKGSYGYLSGTSMACPAVAGEAAFLLAQGSGLSNLALADLITKQVAPYKTYLGRAIAAGAGRISLYYATLALQPTPKIVSFSLDAPTAAGGGARTGTVTLSAPCPVGVSISITSTQATIAAVPYPVPVPPGTASVQFVINTAPVTARTPVTLGATLNGAYTYATLVVEPLFASQITFAPATVVEGAPTTARVTLNGPATANTGTTLALSSSDSTIATVPATATVVAGATTVTFPVTTLSANQDTNVLITATVNGVSHTGMLVVQAITVTNIQLNPAKVSGGLPIQATVTLNRAAGPGGAIVSVLRDVFVLSGGPVPQHRRRPHNVISVGGGGKPPSIPFTVPATVTVPAGQTTANFTVTTSTVIKDFTSFVGAGRHQENIQADFTVQPPHLTGMRLVPPVVASGNSSAAILTLSGPAPSQGWTIYLDSSNPGGLQLPFSVFVRAGQTHVRVLLQPSRFTERTEIEVGASDGRAGVTRSLVIVPLVRQYTRDYIDDLGTGPYAINDFGQVAGSVYGKDGLTSAQASLWSLEDGLTMLPEINRGAWGSATGINDYGQVVGSMADSNNYQSAYLWTPNVPNGTTGAFTWLADHFYGDGHASAINSGGQVAGWFPDAGFLWTPSTANGAVGNTTFLGSLGGGPSKAYAINDYGSIVGTGNNGTYDRAFKWIPFMPNGGQGSLQDLGTPPGSASEAYGINLLGDSIIGAMNTSGGLSHAFLWTPPSFGFPQMGFADLIAPQYASTALSVNATGQVVGKYTDNVSLQDVAFLYTPGEGSVVLDPRVQRQQGDAFTLASAVAINNGGMIVALPGGDFPASLAPLLLTPTESYALSLASFSLPTSVIGGVSVQGTITLTGAVPGVLSGDQVVPGPPALVTLTNDNLPVTTGASNYYLDMAAVPSLASSASFTYVSQPVTEPTPVTLTATYGGVTKSTTITIMPAVVLSSVTFSPSAVTGGNSATATIALTAPAPARGATIQLMVGDYALAAAPQTLVIPAGNTSRTVSVTTYAVLNDTPTKLYATYHGATQTGSLTLSASHGYAVSVTPHSVSGGTQATGSISLAGATPPGGLALDLVTDNVAVAEPPPSAVFSPGQITTTFPILTNPVNVTTTVNLGAVSGVTSQMSPLIVTASGSTGTAGLLPRFDLNGDGSDDLIWQYGSTGDVAYTLMNGTASGQFGYLFQHIDPHWHVVASADLNQDGKPDLLWQNVQTGDVACYTLNGATPGNFSFLFHNVDLNWRIVGAADLNGDHQPDLIWQYGPTGDVAYTLMNGLAPGQFGYLFQHIDPNWRIVGTGDFNGDGKPDILWQHALTGDVAYILMNGTTVGQFGYLFQHIDPAWRVVGTPDLNADGHPDLLWQNTRTGDIAYHFMNGVSVGVFGYLYHGLDTNWRIVGDH